MSLHTLTKTTSGADVMYCVIPGLQDFNWIFLNWLICFDPVESRSLEQINQCYSKTNAMVEPELYMSATFPSTLLIVCCVSHYSISFQLRCCISVAPVVV